eukprot:gene25885-34477_t
MVDRDEAINHDHRFVESCLPPAGIITLTTEYVTLLIIRTAYSRMQLRVLYGEKYPQDPPIIEISSPTLPMPLLRSKEKECTEKVREQAIGKPQLQFIYEQLNFFLFNNLFVPCWREIKQVLPLCEGKASMSADEKDGTIRMKMTSAGYYQVIKLKVPYLYPEEGVQIEFGASSFPSDIQHMFCAQASEIVRRCVAGHSPEQAALLTATNSVKLPQKVTADTTTLKLTAGNLKILKHDVNVLKQISDLRVATKGKGAHSQHALLQENAERREARKELRRLAQSESAADVELQKKLLEQAQQEMTELLCCKVSETAQPSLLTAVKFLMDEYVLRLPAEVCQACKKLVLPTQEGARSENISNIPQQQQQQQHQHSNMRPVRSTCGHWLHHKCMDQWLSNPPFLHHCLLCKTDKIRIWHPDWPEDPKQLEKAWQSKEARKREMADVADFMGMS